MIVYLNSNGTIEQVVPQSLTQGSNNENLIVVGENLSSFTALSAVFKLPNKQVLAPILMTKQQSNYVINNEIVNVWTCSLTEAVTNFSGTLELTINANAGGVITNSYTGAVQIAPTNAPSFPTIDQSAVEVFNQIAEAYGDITGKLDNKQDKLDESLETTNKMVVGAINELNAKEAQNAGDIVDLQSEVEDLHEDINDIQDGTILVGRASADQNGDNIVNTYQKKADNGLDTVNKTVVGGINELKDQAVLNAENIQNANQEITEIKDDYATKVYVDNALAGITIGGAKTLVFDTEQDFLDWLDGTYQRADGKMPSALNIGDAILIKEQDVPDYWVSSKSDPMTINDFTEYEVKIEIPETKIDNDSITKNLAEALQAVKLKNAFTNVDTTVTKSDFSGATKLSKEQYYELLQYGQIEVDGQIITFSDGEFYITPDLSEDFDDRITTLETTVTELTPEVAKSLKTPMTAPISTELVAVDTANRQAMLSIGDGLVIENDTLKATGGVQIIDNLASTSISAALSANQGRVLSNTISAVTSSVDGNTEQIEFLQADMAGKTNVTINNVHQDYINFSSDPQTQLDNKLSLSGGTMAGDIKLGTSYGLVGVTTSGNNYDVFRVNSSNGTLTIGGTYPALNLRGNATRPQYNSSDIAMLSDVPSLRTYQSIVPAGTPIPTNTDLNTVEYLKVGSYYNNKSAEVKDFTNCPTKNAFMMTVYAPLSAALDTEETGGYVYRVRKILDFLGDEYIQYAYSGQTAGVFTYGPWQTVLTTKNVADRIIETYISSDGNTWYRKWASGWKECGGLTTISATNDWGAIPITYPITFTNNPTVNANMIKTNREYDANFYGWIDTITTTQYVFYNYWANTQNTVVWQAQGY